jgi:hypothetical protein
MSPLFRKTQMIQAMAEVLEDGQVRMDEEMRKPKYRNYRGAEPVIELYVRVQPVNDPPFEAKMEAGISQAFLLKPGVRVQVRYDPGQRKPAILEDDLQAILARNPRLVKG